MIDTMATLAYSKDDPADLVNAAIEELIQQRFELPVFNTLKHAYNEVRKKSYRVLYDKIYTSLDDEQKNSLGTSFSS